MQNNPRLYSRNYEKSSEATHLKLRMTYQWCSFRMANELLRKKTLNFWLYLNKRIKFTSKHGHTPRNLRERHLPAATTCYLPDVHASSDRTPRPDASSSAESFRLSSWCSGRKFSAVSTPSFSVRQDNAKHCFSEFDTRTVMWLSLITQRAQLASFQSSTLTATSTTDS